jgi:hypothetical protein
MSLILKTEPLTVTRERRTRCITIDTPEGGFSVSLQRQEIIRDPSGAVLGRGELQTVSFGPDRMRTPERLKLMQAIADTCDQIDAEIRAEAAQAETARLAVEQAIPSETTSKVNP